jgi:integrase/recombinase XerD
MEKIDLQNYKQYLLSLQKSLVYYNFLKPLFEYLINNKMEFEHITKDEFVNYFAMKKYKSNSINNVIKSCRNYCQYKNIKNHPCFEIKLLKTEQKIPNYLMIEDLKKAIRYIATYNTRLNSDKVVAILYTLFFCGLRKSELILLKRENFDFENCRVRVYQKKTKEEIIVPIIPEAKEPIMRYFNLETEEENAFNVTQAHIDYLFRVISKHLGKHITPHCARHGIGRLLDERGVPISFIQQFFGHKDIRTTMRYVTPTKEAVEKEYREKMKGII